MPAELPESYYLDNVRILFAHVEALYQDLLDDRSRHFLQNFHQLDEDVQRLYIRLLNRTGEYFRLSKIRYREIANVPKTLKQLESAGCVAINAEPEQETLLSLFSKAELIEQHDNQSQLKGLKRDQLIDYLINENGPEYFVKIIGTDSIIELNHQSIYQQLQMLFFGNGNQSMTDFVLRDLGLYQYENYRIDSENRPYHTHEEIEQHWFLLELSSLLGDADLQNIELLQRCFDSIPLIGETAFTYQKSEKLKHKIVRQIERLGELDLALQLYQHCNLPPTRERIARILNQLGLAEQSIETCHHMTESPIDESELQFANSFATRLVKQKKLSGYDAFRQSLPYQPPMVNIDLPATDAVESSLANHFNATSGQQCFYLENTLFNGVLGLLIWDGIFAAVPGAFFNPFQYRPADFYAFDFVRKRQPFFDSLWHDLKNNSDILEKVTDCWQHKQGIANPLVDWFHLDIDIIELALQRIDFDHWLAIFNRILKDLRNNRAGFPDLILFPPDKGYVLIEVKGPGDKLQKNQQRWMQYFDQHDIPHQVAQVSWQAA